MLHETKPVVSALLCLQRGGILAQKDLIPFNKRTEEEQKKIARQGGIASGETRRKQKTYREMAKAMLSAKITDKKTINELRKYGVEETDLKALTLLGMIKASAQGSHNAFDRLMELVGEKETAPDQNKFNDGLIALADLINNPAPNRSISEFEGGEDD